MAAEDAEAPRGGLRFAERRAVAGLAAGGRLGRVEALGDGRDARASLGEPAARESRGEAAVGVGGGGEPRADPRRAWECGARAAAAGCG